MPESIKNYQVLLFLSAYSYVEKISILYIFPTPGHSYIDPDRLFANIEKKFREENEYYIPEDYNISIKKHAELRIYKKDFFMKKVKYSVERFKKIIKIPDFNKVRRMRFENLKIGYSYDYRSKIEYVECSAIKDEVEIINSRKSFLKKEKVDEIKRKILEYLEKLGVSEEILQSYHK